MNPQDEMDALSVLASIKQYRSYQYEKVKGEQVWITSDIENFTWFLDTVERLLALTVTQKEEIIDAESKRTKLSKTFFTNEQLDLMISDGRAIKIFSSEKLKQLKKEYKFIEKWYPKGKLTELEKMCRGIFTSLHEYQFLIARIRKGDVDIFQEGNEIFITGNE